MYAPSGEGYSVNVLPVIIVHGPPNTADCPLWRDIAAGSRIAKWHGEPPILRYSPIYPKGRDGGFRPQVGHPGQRSTMLKAGVAERFKPGPTSELLSQFRGFGFTTPPGRKRAGAP